MGCIWSNVHFPLLESVLGLVYSGLVHKCNGVWFTNVMGVMFVIPGLIFNFYSKRLDMGDIVNCSKQCGAKLWLHDVNWPLAFAPAGLVSLATSLIYSHISL